MIDDSVVVEFSRDVVDDERHSELDDHLSAIATYSEVIRAHLNDNANQNETLVFAL